MPAVNVPDDQGGRRAQGGPGEPGLFRHGPHPVDREDRVVARRDDVQRAGCEAGYERVEIQVCQHARQVQRKVVQERSLDEQPHQAEPA